MPRPRFGVNKSSFKLDETHSIFLTGHNLKRGGEFPKAKLRGKRHFWKPVEVVEDGPDPSTDTKLNIKGKPRLKNAEGGGALKFDGSDDLNITLTWHEETASEHTEVVIFEDVDYPPADPP